MRWLIGIDDTDIITSRGTGYHSRLMAHELIRITGARIHGITRHQLLVDPRIKYTSHNSSACLEVEAVDGDKLLQTSKEFLLVISPEGSDTGLCIVPVDNVPERVIAWGERAKKEVLVQEEALNIAEEEGILLMGLTGSHDGVIGSLAAVGLRKQGNDGRFIWLEGLMELRNLPAGTMKASELKKACGVGTVIDAQGRPIPGDPVILLGEWVRPVLKDGKPTLIVERAEKNQDYEYQTAHKDLIRSIS